VAGTSSGGITHSAVSVSSKTVVSQYNEDSLPFGLILPEEEQLLDRQNKTGNMAYR
jgi:hypothetical protein